jgi:hypothetical protein
MTTFLEFAIIAIPLTAAAGAVLFFARGHIHQQMDEIAEAAKSGLFKRPMRFRPLRTLPKNFWPEHRSRTLASEPEPGTTTQAA